MRHTAQHMMYTNTVTVLPFGLFVMTKVILWMKSVRSQSSRTIYQGQYNVIFIPTKCVLPSFVKLLIFIFTFYQLNGHYLL